MHPAEQDELVAVVRQQVAIEADGLVALDVWVVEVDRERRRIQACGEAR